MRNILPTASVLVTLLAITAALADNNIESADGTGKSSASKSAASKNSAGKSAQLSVVGSSKQQWTGVAVSSDRRVFVNYPRWSANVPVSVAQLLKDSSTLPYPDKTWNEWKQIHPADRFVCVQAVYADNQNNLWIVDPAAPNFKGPVKDGAKLAKVDLKTNKVAQVFKFDETSAPQGSYLNDVRIDTKRKMAYLTDSGLGAIVVLDLTTGKATRRLFDHASTKAEDILITINGKPFSPQPDGKSRKIHSDGIALDPAHQYLYYQALTGRNLYRVPVKDLIDSKVSESDLGKKVEQVTKSCIADGIEFGRDGNLYLTSLEDNAVKRWSPSKKGELETVVKDEHLIWPDSLANAPDGSMYVSSSQINLGSTPKLPYRIFKFKLKN
ncbi:MAG TPA: L-dopachrome tautomerase-related protein [Drouetiella sp.]|jgi:sugar lactone lactonase YvrE